MSESREIVEEPLVGEILIDNEEPRRSGQEDRHYRYTPPPGLTLWHGSFEVPFFIMALLVGLLIEGFSIVGVEQGARIFFWFALFWRGVLGLFVLMMLAGLSLAVSFFSSLRPFFGAMPWLLLLFGLLLPFALVPFAAWLIGWAGGDLMRIGVGVLLLVVLWSGSRSSARFRTG